MWGYIFLVVSVMLPYAHAMMHLHRCWPLIATPAQCLAVRGPASMRRSSPPLPSTASFAFSTWCVCACAHVCVCAVFVVLVCVLLCVCLSQCMCGCACACMYEAVCVCVHMTDASLLFLLSGVPCPCAAAEWSQQEGLQCGVVSPTARHPCLLQR